MKYVINSHNTTSIGTYTITKYLVKCLLEHTHISCDDKFYVTLPNSKVCQEIQQLGSSNNVRLIHFCNTQTFFRFFLRCFYDFLIFPLFTFLIRPKSILIMANYCPVKCYGRKIVLMRHSYLVDDNIYHNASPRIKIVEIIRRVLFTLTLRSTDVLIVQSEYMKKLFLEKYRFERSKVKVLTNPVGDSLKEISKYRNRNCPREKIILYASRYYPHKNHSFITTLAQCYSTELRGKNIKFFITIDTNSDKDATRFLNSIINEHLGDIVVNVGLLPQEQLVEYYLTSTLLFFPSKTESFGNPIVEAMTLGLPIVVPNLDYARILCEDCAMYYKHDDIHDAYNKLISICENEAMWNCYSQKSSEQSKKFLSVDEWTHKLLTIMKL